MKSPRQKMILLKNFLNVAAEAPKKRPRMYGNPLEIEARWLILDDLYFVLEDLPEEKNYFRWQDFLIEKGFGTKKPDYEVLNPKDPHSALIKLRNEYERWRAKRRKSKKFKVEKKFIYQKNYKGFWFEKRNRKHYK